MVTKPLFGAAFLFWQKVFSVFVTDVRFRLRSNDSVILFRALTLPGKTSLRKRTIHMSVRLKYCVLVVAVCLMNLNAFGNSCSPTSVLSLIGHTCSVGQVEFSFSSLQFFSPGS